MQPHTHTISHSSCGTSFYCRATHSHTYYFSPVNVYLQVTVDLHNAGATLFTDVVFLGSSYWCGWLGDVGRQLPWEPQGCLWSHTNTAAHRDVLTGVSLSLHHINTLFSLPSVSGACLCLALVISIAQHPRDTLHDMGVHTSAIIRSWKNVFTIWIYLPHHLSKQRGERRTDALHDKSFAI